MVLQHVSTACLPASAPPQVFCASDSRAHEEMRQACFDYLALGGMYSSEAGGAAWWCCCVVAGRVLHGVAGCVLPGGAAWWCCCVLHGVAGRRCTCRLVAVGGSGAKAEEDPLPAHLVRMPLRCVGEVGFVVVVLVLAPTHLTEPLLLSVRCCVSPCSVAAGPVSLLSGLNPRPSVLVMHFFMVALYGFGRCATVMYWNRLPCTAVHHCCLLSVFAKFAAAELARTALPAELKRNLLATSGAAGCCVPDPRCGACGWECCSSTRLHASSCPSFGRVSRFVLVWGGVGSVLSRLEVLDCVLPLKRC